MGACYNRYWLREVYYPWIFIERFPVLVRVLNTTPSKLIRDNKDDERRRRKSRRSLGMNINDSKASRI